MAIKFNRSQTFATNGTVTASGLHNLVDGLDIYQAIITDQTVMSSVGTGDKLLIADADLTASDAPRAVTVGRLLDDALTAGTYTSAQFSNNLSYGTATGNRTVSTNATITTGTVTTLVSNNATLGTTTGTAATITSATIPTLTAGTTTSTAANITNGTVQTLTSSTLASNLTGGTYSGTLNSTNGTIQTLTASTGTITRLSTTLAGDFTISQGTGTLGASGVTAGTYGTSTAIPTIVVDAKGRITSVSTNSIVTGKILQAVQATKTDTASYANNAWADIAGLSVNITPSATSSRVFINANINASTSDLANPTYLKIVRGSTDIYIGDVAGNRTPAGASFITAATSQRETASINLSFIDSPATTSQTTYKIQWYVTSGSAFLNRSATDTNVDGRARCASSIICMEVAA